MHNLSSTAGIVALAAAAVALVAVAWSVALTLALRRMRSAQRAVLGDHGEDLVAHAAHMQRSFEALAQYVEDTMTHLERRAGHVEERLDGAISHRALVRYDAWGEMSGRQSTSIALLDASRSGVVLSSIHHRDHALLYAKQVNNGVGELELSPEEREAVRLAVGEAPAAGRRGGRGPEPAQDMPDEQAGPEGGVDGDSSGTGGR